MTITLLLCYSGYIFCELYFCQHDKQCFSGLKVLLLQLKGSLSACLSTPKYSRVTPKIGSLHKSNAHGYVFACVTTVDGWADIDTETAVSARTCIRRKCAHR